MKGRLLAALGIGMAASACLAADTAEVAKERAKFQGTWQLVSAETDGKPTPAEVCAKIRVTISGNTHSVRIGDEIIVHDVSWEIDPSTDPKSTTDTINDGPDKGKQIRGIYRLEGDTLTSCVGPIDGPRPTEFTAKAGSKQTLRVLKRAKDDAKAEAIKAELKRFEGTWKFASMEFSGKAVPEASFKDSRMVCDGDRFSTKGNREEAHGTFLVDPTVKPKTIDIVLTDGAGNKVTILGIYTLEGDTYTICSGLPGQPRPTVFSSKDAAVQVMTRVKP